MLAACVSAMYGLWTRPRTDVDPPRVELPSGGGAYRLAAPGAITNLYYLAVIITFFLIGLLHRCLTTHSLGTAVVGCLNCVKPCSHGTIVFTACLYVVPSTLSVNTGSQRGLCSASYQGCV